MSKDLSKEDTQEIINKIKNRASNKNIFANFFIVQAGFLLLSVWTDFPLWVYLMPTIFVGLIFTILLIAIVIGLFIQRK